jgi:AraC-like DNA-binding protein
MTYEQPQVYRGAGIRSLIDRALREMPNPKPPADWRVEGILRFIDEQSGKLGWDLNHVCTELELGISGTHAAKLFTRHTGIGIREYAKQVRLTLAAQQLRTTTGSVKQIALELGYRNPNDFCRQFKKLFSLNPTEFRAVCRRPDISRGSRNSVRSANVRRFTGDVA